MARADHPPVRGFRLTPEAVTHLELAKKATGMSQTWIICQALEMYWHSRPKSPYQLRAEADREREEALREARARAAELEFEMEQMRKKLGGWQAARRVTKQT